MTRTRLLGTGLLLAGGLLAAAAHATPYGEVGDAGQTLGTVQALPGGTTSISGVLADTGGDRADVYGFGWAGGLFTASTSGDTDPMLWVFDSAGTRLAFDDDGAGGLQSFISLNLAAGDYLLGVARYADNFNGNLSGFANLGGDSYRLRYTINLRAVTGEVPEPATLGLLGLGLAGAAFGRRRRASR